MILFINEIFDDMKSEFCKFSKYKFTYFDYAATTFMPERVINARDYYDSNIAISTGRGRNKLSMFADDVLEGSREYIKDFFGMPEKDLVFYPGATYALNEIVYSISHLLRPMDIILLGPYEHHSNYLPWRELCKTKGVIVLEMPLLDDGKINYNYIYEIRDRVKIIAFSSVANTNGYRIDANILKKYVLESSLFIVDDSQKCAHEKLDLCDNIDCHILNAHKMYGPKRLAGALISRRLMDLMIPVIYGGGMVDRVGFPNVWKKNVKGFECGTLDIGAISAWKEACIYLNEIGFERINVEEKSNKTIITEVLKKKEVKIISVSDTNSIISFQHEKLHAHDVEEVFSVRGVIIRSGHICSQNSISKFDMIPIVRISFGLGVDSDDMDNLIGTIEECL